MKKQFKVCVENKNFSGMSHGLIFKGGASEIFDNEELYHRLISKGYQDVDVKAELEEIQKQKELETKKIEAEIQKRVDERLKEELDKQGKKTPDKK